MSTLGQERTFAVQDVVSALALIATAKADFGKPSLLLKADMCAAMRDVC